MPTLRTLLNSLEPPKVGKPATVFFVQNNTTTAQNGGCCCLWTVPTGFTRVTFELWGAGGDGGGGCCCHSTAIGSTGGSYAIKTIDTASGCQYRICAAGSGCCNYCCGVGTDGFPSYIYDITAASTIACAPGGLGANMQPTWTGSGEGYTCCWGRLSSCGLGDWTVPGAGGTGVRNQFCHSDQYQIVAGGQWNTGRTSPDRCSIWACAGYNIMKGCTPFPGGGGADGNACAGGFCIGQWGAAGMVRITYS